MNSIEGEVRADLKKVLDNLLADWADGKVDNPDLALSSILKLTNLPNELLPKVNNEYQCEHIKEKVIRSSCVWCNLTVAEKIIDRLKRELTNLKPLEEKEVKKIIDKVPFTFHYTTLIARAICSHFSRPQIKYPEKIENRIPTGEPGVFLGNSEYDGYNQAILDMRKLNM